MKQYNLPNLENISNLHRLRKIFKDYYNLIITLYKDTTNDNEKEIRKDIMKYYYRDEFAFVLNNNIKKLKLVSLKNIIHIIVIKMNMILIDINSIEKQIFLIV